MMFYLKVYVVPGSTEESIEFDRYRDRYRIRVRARAQDNQANMSLIEYVARVLNIEKQAVKIVRGAKSREKLLAIESESVTEEALKQHERRKDSKAC